MMSALDFLPAKLNLRALRQAAEGCRGCELYKNGTQTVFGSGLKRARMMLVGEMPGDEEDRAGVPFVGPAGRLLDELLQEAGIAREDTFVTNAVKHFRWQQRGKRRLHKKPTGRQVEACQPWLHAEITVIEPQIVVCLGATAAQSLLGKDFRLTQQRGKLLRTSIADAVLSTYHPAAILRAPQEDRRRKRQELVSDLAVAAKRLHASTA